MNIDLNASQYQPAEALAILESLYRIYHGEQRTLDQEGRKHWLPFLTEFGFLGLGFVMNGILESDEMRNRVREEIQAIWSSKLGRAPSDQEIADLEKRLRLLREQGVQELVAKIEKGKQVSQKASELMKQDKPVEAQLLLDAALPNVIPNYRFWHEHGLSLNRQGRYTEALTSYRQSVVLNGNDDQFFFWSCEDMKWCYDGIASGKHNEPERLEIYSSGLEYFLQLKEQRPEKWIVLHECGWCALKARRYDEAITYYRQAIEMNQDDAWGWSCSDLRVCYIESQQWVVGYDYFCNLTNQRPKYWGGWHARGWLEWNNPDKHDPKRAIESYSKAIAIHPEKNGWFWSQYDLGWCLYEIGKWTEAYQAFNQASHIDHTSWHAWYGLGRAAESMRDWDKAINAYTEMLQLNSGHGDAWRGLGKAYANTGRFINAWEAYQRAIVIDPKVTERAQRGITKLERKHWRELLQLMKVLSVDEIEQLRFELKITGESFARTSLTERAVRIIEVCEHEDRMAELLKTIREIHPGIIPMPGITLIAEPKPEHPLPNESVEAILQRKRANSEFDVFLCHNSKDKTEVKKIGEQLKTMGILPWLDEWELRPGLPFQRALEEQISQIKSAAVFVSANEFGPWHDMEQNAFIRQFVKRGCTVIPVILPSCQQTPTLPVFLEGMVWVDFRKPDPNPLGELVWGITGHRTGKPQ